MAPTQDEASWMATQCWLDTFQPRLREELLELRVSEALSALDGEGFIDSVATGVLAFSECPKSLI